MRYLAVFDFDFTVIEDDSDRYIVKSLSESLYAKMKDHQKKMQFTELCDMMVGELHKLGNNPDDLKKTLRTIPFNPAMYDIMKLLQENNAEIIVISDANTIYIDEISDQYQIKQFISHVITNPAHFDDDGRLHIRKRCEKHDCLNGCAVNICKGVELLEYINSKGSPYDRLIYVGDGTNDFCPSTKLGPNDYVFPRKDFPFSRKIKDEQYRNEITARINEWESADELLSLLRNLL
ncbi:hypothetical protein HK103_004804 [Boothiomyces macroporosus]|uniref:Uncharacterized protein n=1 Tax=Boothiomyces macroporosus TaxID=261099 RepID=A0AAD5Y3V4_9FUNG|nr:hypothetical protein HK103_004804 [Boothiomyces macroporosus]